MGTETFLKRIIIVGIVMISLFFLIRFAYSSGIQIPRSRHFIYKGPAWYQTLFQRTPDVYVVKSEISNSKDKPVKVEAVCTEVTIDREGKIQETETSVPVKPQIATIYPNQRREFQIKFKIKDETSALYLFKVVPVREETKQGGIRLRTSGGYLLGVTFATRYKPEVEFLAYRVADAVNVTVVNKSGYLIEGTLSISGDQANVTKHFFIEAKKSRDFEINVPYADSAVLDIGGMEHRLGIRF